MKISASPIRKLEAAKKTRLQEFADAVEKVDRKFASLLRRSKETLEETDNVSTYLLGKNSMYMLHLERNRDGSSFVEFTLNGFGAKQTSWSAKIPIDDDRALAQKLKTRMGEDLIRLKMLAQDLAPLA